MKSFAQKLNEHNSFSKKLADITDEMMSLSKVKLEKGEVETAEQIADIAEKCADLLSDSFKNFEEEHGENLQQLIQIVAENKSPQLDA